MDKDKELDQWKSWCSRVVDNLNQIHALMKECVLNEEGGDNVSVTVPIKTWRKMAELSDTLWM